MAAACLPFLGLNGFTMLKLVSLPIAKIYVPVKRRATIKENVVREIAESMLEVGQQAPISVRPDGDRFVLVEAFTGWKRAKPSARKPSSGSWCHRGADSRRHRRPMKPESKLSV